MKKIVSIFLGSALIFTSSVAMACSCRPLTVNEKYQNADAVFVGKVIKLEKTGIDNKNANAASKPLKEDMNFGRHIYTIEVKKVYKGENITKKVRVTTASNSASCGVNYEMNKKYVIYGITADAEDNAAYSTNICMHPLQSNCKEIKAIKQTIKR
jgi:hypothetical protein